MENYDEETYKGTEIDHAFLIARVKHEENWPQSLRELDRKGEWLHKLWFKTGYEAAMKEVEHKIRVADSVPYLFDAIKHGDGKHMRWLHGAIMSHFSGLPVQKEDAQ